MAEGRVTSDHDGDQQCDGDTAERSGKRYVSGVGLFGSEVDAHGSNEPKSGSDTGDLQHGGHPLCIALSRHCLKVSVRPTGIRSAFILPPLDDRHLAAEAGVLTEAHLSHTASAKPLDDLVGTEGGTDQCSPGRR